jgi:hypothetical protein
LTLATRAPSQHHCVPLDASDVDLRGRCRAWHSVAPSLSIDRDPVSGKSARARYKAERDVIAARYHEWEIVGPAEVRASAGKAFSPWK